jgi:hypothetical protein
MIEFQGELIVSGDFDLIGTMQVDGIARWDGVEWHALGNGNYADGVGRLGLYNGEVVAVGFFPTPSCSVARWNGLSWTAGPCGAIHPVAMTAYRGDMVFGGYSNSVPQWPPLYRWNGPMAAWVNGLAPLDRDVRSLIVYNGNLIVGGSFEVADDVPSPKIARWNGVSWRPLGSGMGSTTFGGVSAMTIYNGDLIVGGSFSSAGGVPADHVARWRDCTMCIADVTRDKQVGIDDLVNVITSWGVCPSQPVWCPGDLWPVFLGDGLVNMDDLNTVITGWGPHSQGYDIDDLVAVITGWGECSPTPPSPVCGADITRSGAVNIDDLVAVITAWGPCP